MDYSERLAARLNEAIEVLKVKGNFTEAERLESVRDGKCADGSCHQFCKVQCGMRRAPAEVGTKVY